MNGFDRVEALEKTSLTWRGEDSPGSPQLKRMAEPAEKPRRQTVAPGISTWEAVVPRPSL